MTELVLREARIGDAPAIAGVGVSSRKVARRGLYADPYLDGLSVEPVMAELRRFFEKPEDGWRMWVADEAGEVVAFAKAGPWSEDTSASVAELDELYVEPSRFRQGIGTQLLRFVERALAAGRFDGAISWVLDEDRAAQAFYAANGWGAGDRIKELRKDRAHPVRLWRKALG